MEPKSYSLAKSMMLASISLFSVHLWADVSPLCIDLARYSCAPGNYKDATGSVKSSSENQKFMTAYAEKTRAQLNEKFKAILADPSNAYFKELAIAGLGLKNSPQCSSKIENDTKACQDNLLDGLTTLAQKQTLSPLMPTASLATMSGLSDVSYIMQNEVYQKVISDLNKQAQTDLSNPVVENKIKDKIFPQIKSLIAERLNQLSIPDEQKKFMINKVKSIQFAGSNCGELAGGNRSNSQNVSSLLVPNAFYDPSRNIFKFCSGFLLQSTSEFVIASAIGHELSHSIDPCEISSGPADMTFKYKNSDDLKKMEQEYPLKNVISCLRDEKSIGAKNLNQVPGPVNPGMPFGGGYGAYPPGSGGGMLPQASQMQSKPSFCDKDQITESLADWMGTEVLPRYIEQNYKLTAEQYREGYANTFRIACWATGDSSPRSNFDEHPATGKRINKIILMNPKVRSQMGCPEKHPDSIYCDSDKPFVSSAGPQSGSLPVPTGISGAAGGVR